MSNLPIRFESYLLDWGILHIPPNPKVRVDFSHLLIEIAEKVRTEFMSVTANLWYKAAIKVETLKSDFLRCQFLDLVKVTDSNIFYLIDTISKTMCREVGLEQELCRRYLNYNTYYNTKYF